MAFTFSGSPISIPLGGHAYDPYAEYINAGYLGSAGSQLQRAQSFMAPGSENYFANYAAGSPFNQAANASTQANDLTAELLKSLKSGGGLFGSGGTGGNTGGGFNLGGFDPSSFDLSSYLNLFDVNDERARTGLRDQFTMAGGADNLSGPWSDASSQLERGLGLQRGGHIVDLISRLTAPQINAQSANLQTLITLLTRLLG